MLHKARVANSLQCFGEPVCHHIVRRDVDNRKIMLLNALNHPFVSQIDMTGASLVHGVQNSQTCILAVGVDDPGSLMPMSKSFNT